MPCRIDGVERAGRGTPLAIVGVTLASAWLAGSVSLATPFETDSAMPSVLASTTPPPDDQSIVIGSDAMPDEPYPMGSECPPAEACESPSLMDHLKTWHGQRQACWVGRTDALMLWRDAPPARPLVDSGATATPVLNANQLESTATGGVRGSLLRVDACSGNAWELTYLYGGKFASRNDLPYDIQSGYSLAPPGIYGNSSSQVFNSGTATLLGRLQSTEFNRRLAWGPNLSWLAGFRWVQWHERFTLEDTSVRVPVVNDLYQTTCDNNLYGGQIGADTRLLTLGVFRLDSVVKGGAYYNNAVQTSSYTTNDPAGSGTASVTVGKSPASCSFVGEVGFTGILPLSSNLDFRFGYFGLWLTGLSQPTQQLSGQQLLPGFAAEGTITASGGTLLQGVSLGLEGRW